MKKTFTYTLVIAAFCWSLTAHAVVISFTGSDPIAGPDFSSDFSALPIPPIVISSPQSFDGFNFAQINGDADPDIWTTYNPGGGTGRGWYPNGGDSGYTEITLSGGGNFTDLSLFIGSGNTGHGYVAVELLLDSAVVATQTLGGHATPFHWMSIADGLFDTVRIRDGSSNTLTVHDGAHNALAFDRINAVTSVPEPGTLVLLGIGLAGFGFARRKRA